MPFAAPVGSPVSHVVSLAAASLAAAQMSGGEVSGSGAAGMGGLLGGVPMASPPGLSLAGGDGIVVTGSPDVVVNNRAAGRVMDMVTCHPGASVLMGSDSVFINGRPAARVGDPETDGAVIINGSPNVIIGGGSTSIGSTAPPCLSAASAAGAPFVRMG